MSASVAAAGSAAAVGVVGAGTMGRGIVQLLAQAGHPVSCFDALPGAASQGVEQVMAQFRRAVEKGRLEAVELDALRVRVRARDSLAELADCSVVIEAIVEDLPAKTNLLRALEKLLPASAILASNTSSLSISALGGACELPQRVIGLHFFNPVPLMKVVEIIPGVRTARATVETAQHLIQGTGHRAVLAADQPGFLVNHAGRALYTEGLRMLEERIAEIEDIDTLLREAAGFRMGPFELLDLTGLDVSGRVMESIYEQFFQEPRFRPSALIRPRIAAGLLGRKSGAGWYAYSAEGTRQPASSEPAQRTMPLGGAIARTDARPQLQVWVEPAAQDRVALSRLIEQGGARLHGSPQDADLLLLQCWGSDASSACAAAGLNASRAVAVDPLPGLARRRTLMLSAATTATARDAAAALLSVDGVPVTIINDSPGFVVQRVLALVVNIAAEIAQRGIASVTDIDAAVMLGLGYPRGPLAWGDELGAARVHRILTNLQACTGDPRYRPSVWLARRAALGVSLRDPDPAR